MDRIESESKQIILVTGAARSGKSEWAENLATKTNKSVIYIATAIADSTDREWLNRIALHQQRRPSHWQTLCVPKQLAQTISNTIASNCLLVDSLGSWVANLLDREADSWQEIQNGLLASLQTTSADVILVAEETGWGVIPAYKSGRIFRDRLGNLIRQIGSVASSVYLVTGGHALNLSQLGQCLDNKSN
ncbi:MAG: bifunctional adenosylcobinamide kinase/adenosylcobinamide-phosphate guanylyltransferase [Xenococcaceae cyanobacterium MO_188.B32]|nr:bifunctional adenosylcobinamide kinase/adenosylcobinamide-phosphate guanylyltransferase [Xenococcaceae cyanobacterium MO_188.B32]